MQNIVVHSFTNTSINITWNDAGGNYMFPNVMHHQDTLDVVFMNKVASLTKESFNRRFHEPIPTGVYNLEVFGSEIPMTVKVVLGAIGTLCQATCFLIDGNDLGVESAKDMWLIMSNYHVCSDPEILKSAPCFMCGQAVILRPDLFFRSHTNQGEGLDYIVVAISNDTKKKFEKFGILPNRISTSMTNFSKDEAVLLHKPHISSGHLYTPCKIETRMPAKTMYSYVGFPSSGGSSGSPVFGYDNTGKLSVQGLHRAHGACVNMCQIRTDIRRQK